MRGFYETDPKLYDAVVERHQELALRKMAPKSKKVAPKPGPLCTIDNVTKGDKVVCVDASGTIFKEGRTYTVQGTSGTRYLVIRDLHWDSSRFRHVKPKKVAR